jgi:putative membrane protein
MRRLPGASDPLSNASLATASLTTASTAGSPSFGENRFLQRLSIAMAAVILIAGIHPDKVFDYFLENATAFAFLFVLVLTYRKMPFSDLSYTLMFVYVCMHEWGAHYKYSDVPLGEWMKPWLHTNRNMYDRVAHFSFGLLMTYPLQEVLMRKVGVLSRWRYILPVEAILSFSAIYEMMEAGAAMVLSPERGEEFVGMQGDMWDSQEDMFMAGIGSVAAVIILAVIRHRRAAKAAERELAAVLSGRER